MPAARALGLQSPAEREPRPGRADAGGRGPAPPRASWRPRRLMQKSSGRPWSGLPEPGGTYWTASPGRLANRLHVRSLRTLLALDDLVFNLLALIQGPVALGLN